jgi:hypothetical protein
LAFPAIEFDFPATENFSASVPWVGLINTKGAKIIRYRRDSHDACGDLLK